MDTELRIDQPDTRIAEFHSYWQRNREVVAGTRLVTLASNASRYLTREAGMEDEDFARYVKRVPFAPSASNAHDRLLGLIMRTSPDITCPDNLVDVLETITAQGFTLDDLLEDLHSERLVTNFTGLLTDYPVAPAGLSMAKAVDSGYRPFVAMYKAESILGIELGTVANRQRVIRVRLLDDAKTVRELRLDDGIYSIVIHRLVNDGWVADAPIIPTKGGKPIDEIPFTLDSTSRDFMPVNAPLGDLCNLNIQHYVASANLATEEYYSTVRIFVTKGIKNDVASKLPAYSGARWNFETPDPKSVEVSILSASDNVISDLRETCKDLERKMGEAGLRMLELDQASNVAAETVRIRENAQTASVAGIVRRGDRSINDQLKWVSWWLGLEEDSIFVETPTDFGTVMLTAQDIQTRMALWQSGAISLETLLAMIGSELPENFDPELDRQKAAEELSDRPTTEV